MAGVNRVILVGNLGKDPEISHTGNSVKYARFSIATNESYKDKSGEWQTVTEWHNIIAWRGLAEKAENGLKKGATIYLEGKLKNGQYTDKEGITRYTVDIQADYFTILGPKNPEGGGEYQNNSAPAAAKAPDTKPIEATTSDDDDLPF
jgi:single-strand DNA-binding protein